MPGEVKKFFTQSVPADFFTMICSVAMVFTTFAIINLPVRFTRFTIFIAACTFFIYSFHRISFLLDYSRPKRLYRSLINQKKNPAFISSAFAFSFLLVQMFFLKADEILILLPVLVLSFLYTVPLLSVKSPPDNNLNSSLSPVKKVRIRELLFLKIPILAFVWAISTVVLPLTEQNISIFSPLTLWMLVNRFLFIFALCIPFEVRDYEFDKNSNVRTLPVVYGIKITRLVGIIIILLEIISHHIFLPGLVSNGRIITALDMSAIIALTWIIFEKRNSPSYYYKYLVDGTMLLRFIFVFLAIKSA
jgi:4-hydroxybenzoate polyprenyltransferase